jgi:hypothetical protein
MGSRQSANSSFDAQYIFIRRSRAAESDDRLDDGKRIARTMIHFSRQERLLALGFLSLGNIDCNATHTLRCVLQVKRNGGRDEAPSYFSSVSHNAHFGLERSFRAGRAL